jgi:hypothetical protein
MDLIARVAEVSVPRRPELNEYREWSAIVSDIDDFECYIRWLVHDFLLPSKRDIEHVFFKCMSRIPSPHRC